MNIISFKFGPYESETDTVSNLYDCIMQIIFATQFALNFAFNKVIYLDLADWERSCALSFICVRSYACDVNTHVKIAMCGKLYSHERNEAFKSKVGSEHI